MLQFKEYHQERYSTSVNYLSPNSISRSTDLIQIVQIEWAYFILSFMLKNIFQNTL